MPARRFTILFALVLTALAVCAPSAWARDATVVSFDGTKINTHFFPAAGLGDGKQAPTVFVGHGYGMTGETDENSTSENLFGSVGLGPLRRAGYNVLTWDARGFGQSGGQVEVDTPQFEGRDVQALIDFASKQPEAQLDGPGDPRMGMNGASYGGAIQLVTAAIDRRVDVITPTIAYNDLLTSLYKEQVVKTGWGSILLAGGQTAVTGGLIKVSGPETGSQDPQITQAGVEGVSTGKFSDRTVEFFRSRGFPGVVDRVRVPTLLIEGTADTLFTLDEARRNHAALRANGVPVRMVWFCGGHGVCLTDKGPDDQVEKSVLAWFAHYLKGDSKVATGAPFSYVAQDGKERAGATYPPVENGALDAAGSGDLPLTAGPGNGALIAASPALDAFNLDLPPARSSLDVAGAPKLSLTYSGTGAPVQTHVYGQIVDTARGVVLGNVARPIPVTLDGNSHTLSVPLEMIAYHGETGARLRLQIAPASSLYAPQRTNGLVRLSRVSISIPTVDLRAGGGTETAGGGRRCIPRRASVSATRIGPARVGGSLRSLERRYRVARRGRDAVRFCVRGGGRFLVSARRGRIVLVASTARRHSTRQTAPGRRMRRNRVVGARRVAKNVLVGHRSGRYRVVYGTRRGRVTFVAPMLRSETVHTRRLVRRLHKLGLR